MNHNTLTKLSDIYNALQDEESRMIFEKRLLYAISKDKRHLMDMLHILMSQTEVHSSIKALLSWLKQHNSKEVVIFGAGRAGMCMVEILEAYGIEPSCLCDNNAELHGKERYGKKIISPEQLKDMKQRACIIVGVDFYKDEIYQQVLSLGYKPGDIISKDWGYWLGTEKQYFDSQIVAPAENEVFVDGGAYDGETTLEFFKWHDGKNARSYLFEPDEENCTKLHEKFANSRANVTIYGQGLYSETKELRFRAGIGDSSNISDEGDVLVQVSSIDEKIKDSKVTFIKLDVEGSERKALEGAKKTIRENKPKLAISLYHKPEDIIEIPAYILELNREYKLYIRHYTYSNRETVLYAI